MPLSFCQIAKDDIKLLEFLSQQITSDYVFASFWDCYQYKAKQSPHSGEVKSDFCIVNHKINCYRNLCRLVSNVLCPSPFVTCIGNKEGVNLYKIPIVKTPAFQANLTKAFSIKNTVINELSLNKDLHLSKLSRKVKHLSRKVCVTTLPHHPTPKAFLIPTFPSSTSSQPPEFMSTPTFQLYTFVDETLTIQKSMTTFFHCPKRKQTRVMDHLIDKSGKMPKLQSESNLPFEQPGAANPMDLRFICG